MQACIHHIGGFDRTFDGFDEVRISFTQQIPQDHRMGMLKIFGSEDVRVGIHPKHRQLAIIALVQVGERRQVHEAVTA
ncbi:hypothetical protein D3C85_1330900 [compost metagenome]